MQRTRTNGSARRAVCGGLFGLALLATGASDAQAWTARPWCDSFVGTYLVDNLDDDGSVDSRSLIVLAADGTFLLVDSNQAGVDGSFNPFTDAAGSWSCRRHGLRSVAEAVVLDFTLPGSEGDEQSIARLDYFDLTVDRQGSIEGEATLRFFPLDTDPLHAPPNTATPYSFQGQRITTNFFQRPVQSSPYDRRAGRQ